jgi:hypothetical protein
VRRFGAYSSSSTSLRYVFVYRTISKDAGISQGATLVHGAQGFRREAFQIAQAFSPKLRQIRFRRIEQTARGSGYHTVMITSQKVIAIPQSGAGERRLRRRNPLLARRVIASQSAS